MPVIEWDIKIDHIITYDVVDKSVEHFNREMKHIPKDYLDDIIIELKIIIFEMITNVKVHGGAKNLKLRYTVTDDDIKLEFISDGSGFKLRSEHDDFLKNEVLIPPFPEKFIGKRFIIYKGIEEELMCMVSSSNKLIFHVTPKNVFQNTNEIHEHFGLQLIATVSENFEYHRNSDNLDVFLIHKKIKHAH